MDGALDDFHVDHDGVYEDDEDDDDDHCHDRASSWGHPHRDSPRSTAQSACGREGQCR